MRSYEKKIMLTFTFKENTNVNHTKKIISVLQHGRVSMNNAGGNVHFYCL